MHTQQQSKRQPVQIQQWTLRSKGSLKDWKTSLAPSQRHLSPWLCWQNVQTNRFYEKQNLIPTKKKCVAQSIPTPFGEIVHVQVLHEETAHWNLAGTFSNQAVSQQRQKMSICRSHCVMYVPSWTPALDCLEGFLYTGWSKLGPSYYPPQQWTSHNTSQVQSHHFPANPWKLIVKPHSFKTQMTGRIRFWYWELKSITFEADGSHLSLCNWDYWRRFRWNRGGETTRHLQQLSLRKVASPLCVSWNIPFSGSWSVWPKLLANYTSACAYVCGYTIDTCTCMCVVQSKGAFCMSTCKYVM